MCLGAISFHDEHVIFLLWFENVHSYIGFLIFEYYKALIILLHNCDWKAMTKHCPNIWIYFIFGLSWFGAENFMIRILHKIVCFNNMFNLMLEILCLDAKNFHDDEHVYLHDCNWKAKIKHCPNAWLCCISLPDLMYFLNGAFMSLCHIEFILYQCSIT